MKKTALLFLVMVVGLSLSSAAVASVPDFLPVQGVLTDAQGEPVVGPTDIKFTFYNGQDSPIALWTDTFVDVQVKGGFFTVYLGTNTPLDVDGLISSPEVWVGIEVEGDSEMARFRLPAVPFSLEAEVCQNVVGDITPNSIAVGGGLVVDETGAWVGDPTGLVGTESLQGDKGPVGPVGPQGEQGPAGTVGIEGEKGAPGKNGKDGVSVEGLAVTPGDSGCPTGGSKFISGGGTTHACNGSAGQKGATGDKGDAGIQGIQGIQGAVGKDGKDGVSVQTVTLEPGNSVCPAGGTLFKTAAGDRYACNGPAGAKGDAGAAGDKGIVGLQGPQGPAGKDGEDGGSVTGTKLSEGNVDCPTGGSKFTTVSGDTFACNGELGPKGPAGWVGPTGTAAQWLFDESANANQLADVSGLGNALVPKGQVVTGANGYTQKAVQFNGGRLELGDGNTVPDSHQIWVDAWVNLNSPLAGVGTRIILEKPGAYVLKQVNESVVFEVFGQRAPGTCSVSTSIFGKAATWIHVAGWYNGLRISVALNGMEQGVSCEVGPLVKTAGQPLYVGAKFVDGQQSLHLLGFIDELRIRSFAPTTTKPVQRKHVGAIYRWAAWSTYDQNCCWIANDNNSLFGGVHPSTWGDGGGIVANMSSDKNVLRTLFTQRGYGGKNAMVYADSWYTYSSTNSKHVAVLFRIRNTTNNPVTWTPYMYMTSYGGWGNYASVALNGSNVWSSGGSNHYSNATHSWNLSIPANRVSTVIFSSSNSAPSGTATTFMAFYNNSLALPSGLEYEDDLDIATGGWDQ